MATIGVGFDFRRTRCRGMRRDLYCLSWVRTELWWTELRWTVLWWSELRPTLLWRLSGLRYGRGWRSALLCSRAWLLPRPHVLHLETGTLGGATRSESVDPRPLRRARILIESYFVAADT